MATRQTTRSMYFDILLVFVVLAVTDVFQPQLNESAIPKKSSISDDSSSDSTDLEEAALLADSHLEQSIQRLREEERLLLEQQAIMEAGNNDDIAALENQDLLRLNHLQQAELQKLQAARAQRQMRAQLNAPAEPGAQAAGQAYRREQNSRRRAICTVRVNNLHAAEAIETDV